MDLEKIEEIEKAIRAVPFGQSQYQNRVMTDGHETPERRYRFVLLQLNEKRRALQENMFGRERLELDIEEIESKMSGENSESIAWRRLKIDLKEANYRLAHQKKLIEDALIEFDGFWKEFKEMPQITREQFENAEPIYWQARLAGDARRQLDCMGTVQADLLKELNKTGLEVKVIDGIEGKKSFIITDAQPKQIEGKDA